MKGDKLIDICCEKCSHGDKADGYCTDCYNGVKFSPKRAAESVHIENEEQKEK